MNRKEIRLAAIWGAPMPSDEAGDRLARMLAALGAIDERFRDLLEGGGGPDRSLGWRVVNVSPASLAKLLSGSVTAPANAPKWTPDWVAGFWNGRAERTGASVGIAAVVEGPSLGNVHFGGSIDVNAETDGLTDAQREAIVAAVIDAWDPDECMVRERHDGTTRVRVYTRGEGWRPG